MQIEQVQAASEEVVLAIGGIGSAVAQLDELNAAVASAVEEQGATTMAAYPAPILAPIRTAFSPSKFDQS